MGLFAGVLQLDLEVVIDRKHHGQRLDKALSDLSGLSRSRLQQLFSELHIITESNYSKPSAKAQLGDRYILNIPDTVDLDLTPENIPLHILFEDEYLIVVNKPAGMVVHPSHGHATGTLVHALIHHCPNLPVINGVHRPGIVHRLDKGTSGSLVVAKNAVTYQALLEIFQAHRIERQYIAWVRGNPGWTEKRINLPLGRHPHTRLKMSVRDKGKEAITEAVVAKRYGAFSRLRLQLHTGRTHQIRVHLSHLRLPILGDPDYARAYSPANNIPEDVAKCILELGHQALHADTLGFIHPDTGKEILSHAPLPADLQKLSDALDRL